MTNQVLIVGPVKLRGVAGQVYFPVAIFVVLLPFVQLGLSFYMSIQMVMFVSLFYFMSRDDFLRNLSCYYMLVVLMLFPSILYTILYPTDSQWHMVARASRELLCMSVLLAILSHKEKLNLKSENVVKLILATLMMFFVIALIQTFALKAGYDTLQVPSELLVFNQDTIRGYEKAMGFRLHYQIRPTVFYGEPSYLSFAVLSLLFLSFSLLKKGKYLSISILLSFLICILSRSFSGILACTVLTVLFYTRNSLSTRIIAFAIILMLPFIIMIFPDDLWFVDRLLSLNENQSSVIRLFIPFSIIEYVFSNYPLGMHPGFLEKEFFVDAVLGTDNGLLNIFINYGVSGFVIWGILLYKTRKDLMVMSFVVLSSMFNGAFLSYDKVAIMGFSLLIVTGYNMKVGPEKHMLV